MTILHRSSAWIPAAALLFLAGCGGPKGPELGLVTGKVLNAGVPVKGSMVEFYPEKGRPSMARTNDAGEYELYYNESQKGAKVGIHQVRVSPGSMIAQPTKDDLPIPPLPKPKPGQDVVTMPSQFEVKAGANVIDIELSKVKG